MTIRGRNKSLLAILVVAGVAVIVTLLPTLASTGGDSARELRVVTRDMSFYVDGYSEPNPAISVKAGEKIRLVLRNEDAGMSHDFAVKAWGVGTKLLEDRGQEDAITFQVPGERGTASYNCTPHAKMMSGTLRIE